jgi:hypothetical protein
MSGFEGYLSDIYYIGRLCIYLYAINATRVNRTSEVDIFGRNKSGLGKSKTEKLGA